MATALPSQARPGLETLEDRTVPAGLPPRALEFDLDVQFDGEFRSTPEGRTVTLIGSFLDDGDTGPHFASIRWGDEADQSIAESVPVGQPDGLGQFHFSATHSYTAAGGLPARLPAYVSVQVTVTDDGGLSASDSLPLLVENDTPAFDAGGDLFANEGVPFKRAVTVGYGDAGSLSGEADYGDGSGWQPLAFTGNVFTLAHTYAAEGSYLVTVRVADGTGPAVEDSFFADVLLPLVTEAVKARVGPEGGQVTVSVTGATVTLVKAPGGVTSALILANVPGGVADGQDGLVTFGGQAIGGAYDIRALDVGPDDYAIITLRYANDDFDIPRVSYFDRRLGREVVIDPGQYTVDRFARTITMRLDARTTPRLQDLSGTVFSITVAVPDRGTVADVARVELRQAALAVLTSNAVYADVGGASLGPGGGLRQISDGPDYSPPSEPAPTEEAPADAPRPRKRAPAAAPAATDALPPAPEGGVNLPAVTLTPPQPRRVELTPSTPTPPAGSEEEEGREEETSAAPCDEVFAGMAEEAGTRPASAWMMIPVFLAARTRRRASRSRKVWAA